MVKKRRKADTKPRVARTPKKTASTSKSKAKGKAAKSASKTQRKKAESKTPRKLAAKKATKKKVSREKTVKKKAAKKTVSKKKVPKKKSTRKAAKKRPETKRAKSGKGASTTSSKSAVKTRAKKTSVSVSVKDVSQRQSAEATKAAYDRARRTYRRYRKRLLAIPGVEALTVGARFKNEKATDELAIRLHVNTHEDKQRLKKNPEQYGLKKEYAGTPTDIVVWPFRTGSSSNELPDGTCIRGAGNGTLGTKVVLREDGVSKGVWLTSAHVVHDPISPPPTPVDVFPCNGGSRIGTVSSDEHFRDEELDSALIIPDKALSVLTPPRRISGVRPSHINQPAFVIGAVNQSVGLIDSPSYNGPVVDRNGVVEQVVNHFLVRPNGGVFAESGDSGAIVTLGDDISNVLIGQIRAVQPVSGVAVVTRMTVVRRITRFKL